MPSIEYDKARKLKFCQECGSSMDKAERKGTYPEEDIVCPKCGLRYRLYLDGRDW